MRNRVYYLLKPYLPRSTRMALRRWTARRLLRGSENTWPILESASARPASWPGWPGNHPFALVLTHDVEGPAGLDRVRSLAELEMSWGFRSSFNFIPEGSYSVPPDLRRWLVDNGFEVGVHDLKHDGRLYSSRRAFVDHAARINRYLHAWDAVGFRSGFMQHNLDWMHDLDIAYDASTFDIDPFEPQPDGVRTIFPFWVNGPEGRGYAELPYTLPQDSTLFHLLRADGIAIWQRKLDWIARHGGLALVNVHPDYLRFPGEPESSLTYPSSHYEAFLREARSRYAKTAWAALPRDVARHVRECRPQHRRHTARHIAMITHSVYETDQRVMRYAEALAEAGDDVEVFALRRDAEAPTEQVLNGVKVRRLKRRTDKTERTRGAYLLPLLFFWWRSFLAVSRAHVRQPLAPRPRP